MTLIAEVERRAICLMFQFQDNRLIPSMEKFILNLFSPLPQIASPTLDFPKYSIKSSLFETLGLGDSALKKKKKSQTINRIH